MKHFAYSIFICLFVLFLASPAICVEKPRVFVLTDISNEPDDEESLVRFLAYSNEYDVEGLVATTSLWLRNKTRLDLIQRDIDAYGQVRGNLMKHAEGFPTVGHLMSVSASGQPGFGMDSVGEGQSTPGSQLLIEQVDKPDPRPLWVSVWGGVNTLAQALWDVKYSRSAEELAAFVSKLRVYTISDQDNAGRWLRVTFPDLFYVVSPSHIGGKEYHQSTWSGIGGDRHYKNGPYHYFELVDNPWLEQHIINHHGPLGALYPKLAYIMEGDTPSFLGLINNGLGSSISPSYGGWGGRYQLYASYGDTRPIWTNDRDTATAQDGTTHTTAQATIWRWRDAFQYDFAARMDWCIASNYEDANHNPIAVLNSQEGKDVVELSAKPGDLVALDAEGSSDPDGDGFDIEWFVYREAGTYPGEVKLTSSPGNKTSFVAPNVKNAQTIHVILQLKDQGEPPLFSYRRAIVTVKP